MDQPDLFYDAKHAQTQSEFAQPEHRELGAGAWIEHQTRWLHDHDEIFEKLKRTITWHEEQREMYERMVDVPRLTAGIPQDGEYPANIARARKVLEQRYAKTFTSTRLAWYRDGSDSVAMHGDRIGRTRDETVIAIISLGTPRRFVLKERNGLRRFEVKLGKGDLLVMGGTCQRTWHHGIPKTREAKPRMSIQMREQDISGRHRRSEKDQANRTV